MTLSTHFEESSIPNYTNSVGCWENETPTKDDTPTFCERVTMEDYELEKERATQKALQELHLQMLAAKKFQKMKKDMKKKQKRTSRFLTPVKGCYKLVKKVARSTSRRSRSKSVTYSRGNSLDRKRIVSTPTMNKENSKRYVFAEKDSNTQSEIQCLRSELLNLQKKVQQMESGSNNGSSPSLQSPNLLSPPSGLAPPSVGLLSPPSGLVPPPLKGLTPPPGRIVRKLKRSNSQPMKKLDPMAELRQKFKSGFELKDASKRISASDENSPVKFSNAIEELKYLQSSGRLTLKRSGSVRSPGGTPLQVLSNNVQKSQNPVNAIEELMQLYRSKKNPMSLLRKSQGNDVEKRSRKESDKENESMTPFQLQLRKRFDSMAKGRKTYSPLSPARSDTSNFSDDDCF